MNLLCIIAVAAALSGQTPAAGIPGRVGGIICFSDSALGERMAEAAAKYLQSEGLDKYFSKSFVVTGIGETEEFNRLLILIMTAGGEKAFESAPAPFRKALLELLDQMKVRFGDTKVSVVLQREDKSNVIELDYSKNKAAVIRDLYATPSPSPVTPTPAKSPVRTPSAVPPAAAPSPIVPAQ